MQPLERAKTASSAKTGTVTAGSVTKVAAARANKVRFMADSWVWWELKGLVNTILATTAPLKWCNYVWLQSIRAALQEHAMAFLILGLIFLVLKLAGVDPVAQWSWWWVLSPFALAALWWLLSDLSGRTKRLAMQEDAQRKADRISESKKRLYGTKK